jgi:hypothetical protein
VVCVLALLVLAAGVGSGAAGSADTAKDTGNLLKNPAETKASDVPGALSPLLETGRVPDLSRWLANNPDAVAVGKDGVGTSVRPIAPIEADDPWRSFDTNAAPLGKGETMDDLAREFSSHAFDGLVKSSTEDASADPKTRNASKERGANQLAASYFNLRDIIGGLSRVDSVNGLGEPIGLSNRAVSEIDAVFGKDSNIVVNGLGEPIGNLGESHGNPPPTSSYATGGGASDNREISLPSWLVSLSDMVGDVTVFVHENLILVVLVCVAIMGVSTLIQRNH